MRQRMYRVITAATIAELENQVNKALQDGADLVGGVGYVGTSAVGQWFQAVMCWY